jgi:hypothetical protein
MKNNGEKGKPLTRDVRQKSNVNSAFRRQRAELCRTSGGVVTSSVTVVSLERTYIHSTLRNNNEVNFGMKAGECIVCDLVRGNCINRG